MFKRVGANLAFAATLILLLAGCGASSNGDNGTAGTAGDAITIKETEMTFTPNNITVQAGQTVNIKLVNNGIVMHDFTIDDLNGQQISKPLDPGKSTTFSLAAPSTAGTINFYCSQPGHKAAGMFGTITVQ